MKFTDEQIVSLQSITGRYSEDHSYSFEMLCDDIESILTPPVQDGGEALDQNYIKLVFERRSNCGAFFPNSPNRKIGIDAPVKALTFTGFKNAISDMMQIMVELRTASLTKELEEAKREIELLKAQLKDAEKQYNNLWIRFPENKLTNQ